jgi:octopine/nopaline transport system permease protein
VEKNFFYDSLVKLLNGVPLTLELTFISVSFGFLLATALAFARRGTFKPAIWFAKFYVFVFRGTPLLVQMYILYYGPSQFEFIRKSMLWEVLKEPFWCALISLSLVTAAYGSEVIRGGLDSVERGSIEAARAFGMSPITMYKRIIFPLALRSALPAYGNEIILMVKATSLASIITLTEITGIAYRLIAETYRVAEVFIIAGAIYLAINFAITVAISSLEKLLQKNRKMSF